MIATILRSSASFNAIDYNERKVKEGMAELLEIRNIFGISEFGDYSSEELRRFFIDYSARNDRIKLPQFHVAISCKGHQYSPSELLEFAHRYMEEMGYMNLGHPMVVYAHHDTDNTHIHIITSRIAPDGHKIDHNHERRRSQAILDRLENIDRRVETGSKIEMAKGYRFASESQFCAILQSMGLQTSIDKENRTIRLFCQGQRQGTISFDELTSTPNNADDTIWRNRLRQLRAIVNKYQQTSVDKQQLRDTLRQQFGVDLVFHGSKDSPYGYTLVDHSTKQVFAGSEVMKIKQLLNFEAPAGKVERSKKILTNCISQNEFATSREINRQLRRVGGGILKKGKLTVGNRQIDIGDASNQIRENDTLDFASIFAPQTDGEVGAIAKMFRIKNIDRFRQYLSKKGTPKSKPLDWATKFHSILRESTSRKDFLYRMKSAKMRVIEYQGTHYIIDTESRSIAPASTLGIDYNAEMQRLSLTIKPSVGGGSSRRQPKSAPSPKPNLHLHSPRILEGLADGNHRADNREWEVGKDTSNDYTLS